MEKSQRTADLERSDELAGRLAFQQNAGNQEAAKHKEKLDAEPERKKSIDHSNVNVMDHNSADSDSAEPIQLWNACRPFHLR